MGQPGFATAERPDDVVERVYVAQLKALAAPRPGKLKGNAALGGRCQQLGQVAGDRRLAVGEVGTKLADLLDRAGELVNAPLESCLMRRQGRLQAAGVAVEHPRHLGKAEA